MPLFGGPRFTGEIQVEGCRAETSQIPTTFNTAIFKQVPGVRKLIRIAGTIAIVVTAVTVAQRAKSQSEEAQIKYRPPRPPPLRFPSAPSHVGAAMTSPNIGGEGTLDVLEGGGSSRVWSFDIESESWQALENAPTNVGPGGAISNLFNGCDFAFAGGGSSSFFSTGTICRSTGVLADTPAPVGAGAALATAPGFGGSTY